jgi:hypothetical protein
MMHKHIGPYQRPAPPKKPILIPKLKTAPGPPPVSLHDSEGMENAVKDALFGRRKPGRPSINEVPMTPAERQARRRERQAREHEQQVGEAEIKAALDIGDSDGKSRAETRSGGFGAVKLDAIYAARETEFLDGGDGGEAHTGRRIWIDPEKHRVKVGGLKTGDEESNRRLFAEEELRKMVCEYFTSSNSSPSASWIAKHVGNSSIQNNVSPVMSLECKLCSDTMSFVGDAKDHLRVDHKQLIKEWFKKLSPRREFRDMKDYVTVAMPFKRLSNEISKT